MNLVTLFQKIAPHYDTMNTVLSLGLHRHWEHRIALTLEKHLPPHPTRLLDLATGTGTLGHRLGSRLPQAEVWGLDPCRRMMAMGRKKGRRLHYVHGVAEDLPFSGATFDGIACAYGVRNFSNRPEAYWQWWRCLRPGGVVAVLEIHRLEPGPWTVPQRLYWNLLPQLGRLVGSPQAYRYLRDSARGFLTRREMVRELERFGFRTLESRALLPGGLVSLGLFERVENESDKNDRRRSGLRRNHRRSRRTVGVQPPPRPHLVSTVPSGGTHEPL